MRPRRHETQMHTSPGCILTTHRTPQHSSRARPFSRAVHMPHFSQAGVVGSCSAHSLVTSAHERAGFQEWAGGEGRAPPCSFDGFHSRAHQESECTTTATTTDCHTPSFGLSSSSGGGSSGDSHGCSRGSGSPHSGNETSARRRAPRRLTCSARPIASREEHVLWRFLLLARAPPPPLSHPP